MTYQSLVDKVAVVTGGSRGIGKAIALHLAQAGANVVVASRSSDANPLALPGTVDQTAREIEALGRRALAIPMDLTREEDVQRAFEQTFAEFGRVDVLVNNAAISFSGTVAEISLKRWDLVFDVNMRGTFLCCKAVLPHMMKKRSGHIVNISSSGGWRRGPDRVAYGASKAALDRFSVGLSEELREYGVAVNDIVVDKSIATEGYTYLSPHADTSNWEGPDGVGEATVFVVQQETTYTGHVLRYGEMQSKYGFGLPGH